MAVSVGRTSRVTRRWCDGRLAPAFRKFSPMSAIGADCTDRRRLDAGKSKAGIVVSDRWHVQKWADLGHLIASVASVCRAIAYPTDYATAHWPDRTLAQCHGHAPLFRRRSRQESRVVVQGQTDQGIGRRGHFAGSFLAHALDEFFQPGACRQLPGHGLVSTGCSDSHRLLHRWQWNEWAIPPPLRPDLRSGKRWEIGRSTAAELGPLAARPADGRSAALSLFVPCRKADRVTG